MKAIGRIKQYIDYKGLTNRAFEQNNDLSNGYIATQLKRNIRKLFRLKSFMAYNWKGGNA